MINTLDTYIHQIKFYYLDYILDLDEIKDDELFIYS